MAKETFQDIKRHRNHFTFLWAVTELMSKGIDYYKDYPDGKIEQAYKAEQKRQAELPENEFCIYVPEVLRDALITARQLANLEFIDLINGIVKADLWKAHTISYDRMCEIASCTIDGLREDDEEQAIIYLRETVELDDTECEYFGVPLEDDEIED